MKCNSCFNVKDENLATIASITNCKFYSVNFHFSAEQPVSGDVVWILGDNFVAKSFRNHYKKCSPRTHQHFIKEFYDYLPVCSSRFSSPNTNMLARLQNVITNGFNAKACKEGQLPRYIIVVLDDDLISHLEYRHSDGLATLLGTWVTWLVDEIQACITACIGSLPKKCTKFKPFLYWVTVPTHQYFSKECNALRIKFNLSLESVVKQQHNMRIVELKEFWNSKDSLLVMNDRITEFGMTAYWNAVDATFKYNAVRHEQFIAKHSSNNHRSLENSSGINSPKQEVYGRDRHDDPMKKFFKRNKTYDGGRMDPHEVQRRLHGRHRRFYEDQHDQVQCRTRINDRFLLP